MSAFRSSVVFADYVKKDIQELEKEVAEKEETPSLTGDDVQIVLSEDEAELEAEGGNAADDELEAYNFLEADTENDDSSDFLESNLAQKAAE